MAGLGRENVHVVAQSLGSTVFPFSTRRPVDPQLRIELDPR